MNSPTVSPTWSERVQGQIFRVLRRSTFCISCIQRQHQVHPLSANSGRNKFLQLSAQRRIRIVHIDSKKLSSNDSFSRKSVIWSKSDHPNGITRSHSLVSSSYESSEDEYWFTRWNQPLKISNNCNCSFKRKRISVQDTVPIHIPPISENLICDTDLNQQLYIPAPENTNLPLDPCFARTFALSFVQDIIDDALTHVALSTGRQNDRYHFTSIDDCLESSSSLKHDQNHQEHISDGTPVTNVVSVSLNNSSDQQPPVESVLSETSGLCQGEDMQPSDGSKVNSGCINLSFLCSPSDPITNPSIPKPKSCNHTKRTKKPLLYFLHGVGSSADIWWGLLRYFVSAGYEVLAPDMLGHGYSAAPDQQSAYTFQHLLKDTIDIFDRFVGEHGKCVVIGHAYGCSLAAAVARYRSQVSHLVLISGGGPTPLAPTQQSPMFPCFRGCMEAFLVCGFKRDVLYAPCGKQMTSYTPSSCDVPEYVLRYMARGQDWPEGDSTFHRRILVPTLLVHGMRDPHVTLVQECEMERTIPRSFLELIPNAGHLAMLETPAQLSHMINCFIDWWSR